MGFAVLLVLGRAHHLEAPAQAEVTERGFDQPIFGRGGDGQRPGRAPEHRSMASIGAGHEHAVVRTSSMTRSTMVTATSSGVGPAAHGYSPCQCAVTSLTNMPLVSGSRGGQRDAEIPQDLDLGVGARALPSRPGAHPCRRWPPRAPARGLPGSPPGGTVARSSGQLSLDGGHDGRVLGLDLGPEARHDRTVGRDQELLEVPVDVARVALGVGVWSSAPRRSGGDCSPFTSIFSKSGKVTP